MVHGFFVIFEKIIQQNFFLKSGMDINLQLATFYFTKVLLYKIVSQTFSGDLFIFMYILNNSRFSCEYCGVSYKSLKTLNTHLLDRHEDALDLFTSGMPPVLDAVIYKYKLRIFRYFRRFSIRIEGTLINEYRKYQPLF